MLRDSYTTNNVGARVNYTPLSAVIAAAGGSQVLVDTQNSTLSSIDFYNGNLELRNFHLQQNETLNPQYPTQVQQYDIVLRENNGNGNAEVKYTSLSALGKNLYTTVDGELQSVGNSIRKDYDRANSTEYIGLWNFDNHTPETLEAELEYGKWKYVHLNGSGDTADAGTDFLLWNNAGGTPFLDYTDIKIRLPKPSTSDVEGLD